TQRIKLGFYKREKTLPFAIELQVDIDHVAKLQTTKIDGRADFQATYGLLEMELDREGKSIRIGHCIQACARQFEGVIGLGRLGNGLVGRCKGDTAGHQRNQGLGLHIEPVGIQREVDATGIPESGVVRNKLVVRGVDKNLDVDRLAAFGQVVANNPSDLYAPVVH